MVSHEVIAFGSSYVTPRLEPSCHVAPNFGAAACQLRKGSMAPPQNSVRGVSRTCRGGVADVSWGVSPDLGGAGFLQGCLHQQGVSTICPL